MSSNFILLFLIMNAGPVIAGDCEISDVYRDYPYLKAQHDAEIATGFDFVKFQKIMERTDYPALLGAPMLPETRFEWQPSVYSVVVNETSRSCSANVMRTEGVAIGYFNGTWAQLAELALLWTATDNSIGADRTIGYLLRYEFITPGKITGQNDDGSYYYVDRPIADAAERIALDEDAVHAIGMMAYGLDIKSIPAHKQEGLRQGLQRLYKASDSDFAALVKQTGENAKWDELSKWRQFFLRRYRGAGQDRIVQYRVMIVLAAYKLKMPVVSEWARTVAAQVAKSHLKNKDEYAAVLGAIN